MEIKKAPEVDLEKGKGLSLLLGLVVALAAVFVALEWRSSTGNLGAAVAEQIIIEDALLIQDEQQEEQPEPEPVVQQQQIEAQLPEEFNVVDDKKEVAKISFVSADEAKPLPPPAPVGPAVVEAEETEDIFDIVEESCEFPGGMGELMKWLSKNIEYPEIAQENGVQGRVTVAFVIEKNGKPTDVKVVRGVDPSLDKEALRVVSKMPNWKPGKQRGKPVRQRFTMPVLFRLQ